MKRDTYYAKEQPEEQAAKFEINNIKRLIKYAIPYKKIFILVFFLVVTTSVLSLIPNLILRDIINKIIPEKDLRIDIFCAGGHGGQGVNTTYSAIRMTHLPTGLVAQCQDERSQQRNKEKCLATLKARILDQRRRAEEAKTGADRLSLRGSGDRSERIRTYNFPQNRLTDHRVDLTLYSLDRIVEGEMDPVLEALRTSDLDQRITAALNQQAGK